MKSSDNNIGEIFEFSGKWGVKSKCGIKIRKEEDKTIVIATELYNDNPGTTITSVTASLAQQVCQHYNITPENLIYIECNPEMNSKLSFYAEEYYQVEFTITSKGFENPKWKKIDPDEIQK